MVKKIIVLRGTVKVLKKIASGPKKGEMQKVTLGPGDPVGSLIKKDEKDRLIDEGVLGYADDLNSGESVIDSSELAGELEASNQKLADSEKALIETQEKLDAALKDLAAAEGERDEAKDLAGKASQTIAGLESDLKAAKGEIAELKKKA